MAMSELTSTCFWQTCVGLGLRRGDGGLEAIGSTNDVMPAQAGTHASLRTHHVGIR